MLHTELDQLARACGATAYTNRHHPHQPAIAFGPDAWAKFCAAVDAAREEGRKEATRPSGEELAGKGWQAIECPVCGGLARAFPKPTSPQPSDHDHD
jgi:hypothetical protein